jgi:AAA domain
MSNTAPVLAQLLTGECVVGQPPFRHKSDFLHVVLSQAHHLQIVFLLLGDLEQVVKQIAELEDSVESVLADSLDELEQLLGISHIQADFDAFVLLPDVDSSEAPTFTSSLPIDQTVFQEEIARFPGSRMADSQPLAKDVFQRLSDVLFPQREWRRSELVKDDGRFKRRERRNELDSQQKSAAWGLGYESTVIEGGPGSGKTLVLVSRALWLGEALFNAKILLLTWNRSLAEATAGWLRTLSPQNSSNGKASIESLVFADFLKRHDIELSLADPEDADFRCRELLRRKRFEARYDSVLVDEAQDFGDLMLGLVNQFVIPGRGGLSLSLDSSQNIRVRPLVDLQALPTPTKKVKLDRSYRSTSAIRIFSEAFSSRPNQTDTTDNEPDNECEKVRLVWAETEDGCLDMVVAESKRLVEQLELRPEEIMVVCFLAEQRNRLKGHFSAVGLQTSTPGRLANGIVITSPEVSKGHEASCVFVLGWDADDEQLANTEGACRRFVASSRAADILYVVYTSQRIPPKLLECSQAIKQLWPDDFERID